MSTATAPAAPASSDLTDGPVLSVINKRIRALRKKQNRISQMEDSVLAGKTLNKEQEETLRSKPYVIAAIDELEKLKQPISVAVSEEIAAAASQTLNPSSSTISEQSSINDKEEEEEEQQQQQLLVKKDSGENSENLMEDLLNLLYFGSMFDVKDQHDFKGTMLRRNHERGCCLTYDYVTDDDSTEMLEEVDLNLISMLGGLLISRPVNSSLSHKNALLQCIQHAKLWLAKSDQPIEADSTISYAGLREKLNKIMSSDYFTTTPEMRAPVEVATAAGTYGSFQVPVHGGPAAADLPEPVQGTSRQSEHQVLQEEQVVDPQGEGVYDNPTGHLEDSTQGDVAEISTELPNQTEALHSEVEPNPQEFDKGQHYTTRRPFEGHRGGRVTSGGGRRGYTNGRGGRAGSRGGGYSNGRQYYDYPRSNYRGRGGRGTGGSFPGQGSYLVGDA